MEFIRKRMAQLTATWGQLSPSGRFAIVMTVLLVVAILVITAHYAGKPELTSLPTRIASDDLGRAMDLLRAQGINAEVRGGEIFVPEGKDKASLAILSGPDALSPEIDWDKVVSTSGPWTSNEERERIWRLGLKRELELIMKGFPGVKKVRVNVNYGSEHTLRSVPEGVSASVSVETQRNKSLDKSLAKAMADLVSGAVHGLRAENVKVIDTTSGRSFNLAADTEVFSADYVQTVKTYQNWYDESLRKQFAGIRNLVVGVHVVPDFDKETRRVRTVDPTQKIAGGTQTSERSTSAGGTSGSPGVSSNTGSGNGGEARTAADTSTEEVTSAAIDYGITESLVQRTPGAVKEISVAISVPRSYLVDIAKLRAGASAPAAASGGAAPAAPVAPDEAAIAAVFNTEKEKIAQQAQRVIGAKDAGQVQVDWYYDLAGEPVVEEKAPFTDTALGFVAGYGPTLGLGVLALLALWMVFSVVRKVQPASAPAELHPTVSAQQVNEAGLDLDSILEGVELEAETIRASKMQEQISSMIKEDPENVAGLFKRWMSQE